MKVSDDHTLFAWGLPEILARMREFSVPRDKLLRYRRGMSISYDSNRLRCLLADSPVNFAFSY